jgi:DNA-binding IclR family transcriptional regulator
MTLQVATHFGLREISPYNKISVGKCRFQRSKFASLCWVSKWQINLSDRPFRLDRFWVLLYASTKNSRNGVSIIEMNSSVLRAIDLLEELARFQTPVPLKDLARNTKLDKATAYRLLNSLWKKGLVHKIGNHGFYALGPKLLAFAEEYRRSFTMRDTVLPYLERLVHATGETAIYCERFDYDSCVTIERRESPHHTRTVIETGIRRPLYVGSSALAILAMLPRKEILSVLNMKPLQKVTPSTITSQKQILKRIEEIKQHGYAISIQERYLYTAGVAAPCFLDQSVIGSIAIIGPAERIRTMGIEKAGKTIKRIADQLSTELGHSINPQYGRAVSKGLRLVK